MTTFILSIILSASFKLRLAKPSISMSMSRVNPSKINVSMISDVTNDKGGQNLEDNRCYSRRNESQNWHLSLLPVATATGLSKSNASNTSIAKLAKAAFHI